LGFVFICGKSRWGKFLVHRKSRRDRMRAKLAEIKKELRKRMHQPIPEQGRWLGQVVRGYFGYHAVPTNRATIGAFHRYVARFWYRTLRRRSQKDRFTWERAHRLAADWLPQPRNFHPGHTCVSPSNTRGKNRMPELGSSGSLRVVPCKCVQLSRLRWWPRQSLASSRVPSLAWWPVTAAAKRRQGGCRPERQ
jgi:hypothetical protein